jgi:hypothetical protein
MSASSWRRLPESSYFLDEPRSDVFSPPNGLETLELQGILSSDEEDDNELSLPSAGIANVRTEETPEPEEDDEDVDIGEFDWGDADKEVNDFLAELGEDGMYTTDDSDNERWSPIDLLLKRSVASNGSESHRKRKRKRKRESRDPSSSESDTDSPSELRSPLAKRKQNANSRKSQLSRSLVVSKPSSESVSPNGSHRPSEGERSNNASDGEDSDLDDWANEFEKELD